MNYFFSDILLYRSLMRRVRRPRFRLFLSFIGFPLCPPKWSIDPRLICMFIVKIIARTACVTLPRTDFLCECMGPETATCRPEGNIVLPRSQSLQSHYVIMFCSVYRPYQPNSDSISRSNNNGVNTHNNNNVPNTFSYLRIYI